MGILGELTIKRFPPQNVFCHKTFPATKLDGGLNIKHIYLAINSSLFF